MGKKLYTEEYKKQVVDCVVGGNSMRAVALKFGLHQLTVRSWVDQFGYSELINARLREYSPKKYNPDLIESRRADPNRVDGVRYSEEYKQQVIDYVLAGGSIRSAGKKFDVTENIIRSWIIKRDLYDHISGRKRHYNNNNPTAVFDDEKVKAYVKQNPIFILKDMAKHFGGSINGARHALKRNNLKQVRPRNTERKYDPIRWDMLDQESEKEEIVHILKNVKF